MASPINLRMSERDWGILLALSVLWGGSFFFIDLAVEEISPFTLVLLRVALAAAILLGFLSVTRRQLPFARSTVLPFLLLALLIQSG